MPSIIPKRRKESRGGYTPSRRSLSPSSPLMGFHYPTNDPEVQRLLVDSDKAIQESEEFNENAQELIEFLDTHRTLEDF